MSEDPEGSTGTELIAGKMDLLGPAGTFRKGHEMECLVSNSAVTYLGHFCPATQLSWTVISYL